MPARKKKQEPKEKTVTLSPVEWANLVSNALAAHITQNITLTKRVETLEQDLNIELEKRMRRAEDILDAQISFARAERSERCEQIERLRVELDARKPFTLKQFFLGE